MDALLSANALAEVHDAALTTHQVFDEIFRAPTSRLSGRFKPPRQSWHTELESAIRGIQKLTRYREADIDPFKTDQRVTIGYSDYSSYHKFIAHQAMRLEPLLLEAKQLSQPTFDPKKYGGYLNWAIEAIRDLPYHDVVEVVFLG